MQHTKTIRPLTLSQKILADHKIATLSKDAQLVRVDRLYMDESCYHCLAELRVRGLMVKTPATKYAMVSHLAPTFNRAAGPTDPEINTIFRLLEQFEAEYGIDLLHYNDPRQGIYHVVGPEQGITLPGLLVAGTDSHMTTHGGVGALSFSVGYEETIHILAHDAVWSYAMPPILIEIWDEVPFGMSPKDLSLDVVRRIGANGGLNCCIEFAGSAVSRLSVEGRMTLCNLMVEAGARAAIVAVDDKTIDYFHNRPSAPKDQDWDKALEYWRDLTVDSDAKFLRRYSFSAADLEPLVSWGTTTEHVIPVTGAVPEPSTASTDAEAEDWRAALDYMGLQSGRPIEGLPMDQVFIGSCTNGRIEDLRAAAAVLKNREALIPGLVVPGSTPVKKQAESEGLDKIFLNSGLKWGEAGCSMCFGHHDSIVPPGQRCASTTNRSFPGRQGPGSRTHLMSPAMAAAAAVSGRIIDVRKIKPEGQA